MKIGRFRIGKRIAFGVVQGDEVMETRGSIFGNLRITNTGFPLNQVKVLPPTDPVQIWCPGPNFTDHQATAQATGGSGEVPFNPSPWLKGRNSLIGHEDYIVIPKQSTGDVHYEGEVVAVIGKTCRRVSTQDAPRYILGYTCGNDVSERTWQQQDRSMWRAKGADTFGPVGPWISMNVDPGELDICVRLNGQEVRRTNSRHMIFDFPTLVSYISQAVTLYPGDLIFSGASGETRSMKPGDVVEVEIGGIGVLRNTIRAEEG